MNSGRILHSKDNENDLELLFAEIFRKHESGLYMLSLRLTKSDLYAKDIIQEVFLKLWEHRHQLHTIQNIEAWLCRATENKIIDLFRKAAADERLRDALWNNAQKDEDDTESCIIAKDYDQTIRKAIDQLPPQRKLIYYLNKEEGLSYNQIAQELSISRHTVKNQLYTALQSVRNFFKKSINLFSFFL